jgi:hypothetical protein
MTKKNVTVSKVERGMGATICHWSDRTPATVIDMTASGKTITLQADKYTRTDDNGMSEDQSYEYERDPNGTIYRATLRKDGRYRLVGSKEQVSLGSRRKYHDYSF